MLTDKTEQSLQFPIANCRLPIQDDRVALQLAIDNRQLATNLTVAVCGAYNERRKAW